MAGQLQLVRDYRKMPFLRRGMRCNMDGRWAKVTSGFGAGLMVLFDDATYPKPVHPKWQMTYYDTDGNIVAEYKEKKEETVV